MSAAVHVLGTAQDGGIPHAGCRCATCVTAREDARSRRLVSSIAVVGLEGRSLVIDATPDLPAQLDALAGRGGGADVLPDALLLTHAHMGHFLGLAWLGREAMDASKLPVYVTRRMGRFLEENRPWANLLTRRQLLLREMDPEDAFEFDGIRITPFVSPHRTQDSDTVGVEIQGPTRKLLYLPDADRFPADLVSRIQDVDLAMVDGTFYDAEEVGHRDVDVIPHPFVKESVELLAGGRGEVCFTHLNHTNPLAAVDPAERPELPEGFRVLADGETLAL